MAIDGQPVTYNHGHRSDRRNSPIHLGPKCSVSSASSAGSITLPASWVSSPPGPVICSGLNRSKASSVRSRQSTVSSPTSSSANAPPHGHRARAIRLLDLLTLGLNGHANERGFAKAIRIYLEGHHGRPQLNSAPRRTRRSTRTRAGCRCRAGAQTYQVGRALADELEDLLGEPLCNRPAATTAAEGSGTTVSSVGWCISEPRIADLQEL